jgi:hypothetical protein
MVDEPDLRSYTTINGNTELLTIFSRRSKMVRNIKLTEFDEVDVLTYSDYMQALRSGYLEYTINIQADPSEDAAK